MCMPDGEIPKIWILLDSEATENIIISKKLVKNIRKTAIGCRIYGSTGNNISNEVVSMVGVGFVSFNRGGPANILSLARMRKKYRIFSDSWNGK